MYPDTQCMICMVYLPIICYNLVDFDGSFVGNVLPYIECLG